MHALIVFVTAVVAGGINSIAAGGSLLTFPTLIWPGTLGSVWSYRRELRGTDRRVAVALARLDDGAAAAGTA